VFAGRRMGACAREGSLRREVQHNGSQIADGRLLGVAKFDEGRSLSLVSPYFERVRAQAEKPSGLFVVEQIVEMEWSGHR
jgi:hypothetical protein